ncbi:MAG: hypothetical protein UT21_C0006G0037 [Candidatus Woesebacteria bacterium GW2011_GWA1_39_11b]|nr:MAG: hypothetical protein UT21_C0006G0037 [Candidatus Woesebacteria bacterium GW2011_GWA1_39_11b]KKS77115.1 MAG: hypothetical protein UV51_C0010G0020 [Candidatus Woesebacteria bacterium GW2011_GWC1_42_9]
MKQIFENEKDANKRADMIEANACVKTKTELKRHYSPNEMAIIMQEFCHVVELIESKEEEMKDLITPIKEEIKKLKKESRVGIDKIRRKYEVVEADIYGFDDQETGVMEFFDINGNFISSRRLVPEERQLRLKAVGEGGK